MGGRKPRQADGKVRLALSVSAVLSDPRASGNERGYVMDLATLWRLAAGWYEGRLAPGYQRRDPASSAEYFSSVGLRGPFWGL